MTAPLEMIAMTINGLLNRYYKYRQNMGLSRPKILISVQTDWL